MPNDLPLTKVSETNNTITLGWTPITCSGYEFLADGKRVSNTWNPGQSSVKFAKVASGKYAVQALGVIAEGTYPPPIPPPPTGKIISKVDYAAPSPYGYTWGIQAGNTGTTDPAHQGTILDTATVDGKQVGHMYVPSKTGGRAAEGLVKRTIDPGVTDFYALSVLVGTGWHTLAQNTGWSTLLAQFNYSNVGDGGPPVSLKIGQTTLELLILSGHVSLDGSGNANGYEFNAQNGKLQLTNALPENEWVDVIVEIKWGADWTGHVNAWTRPTGAWVQKVDSQNLFGKPVPTQQWNSQANAGSQIDINGTDLKTGHTAVTCDKNGLYAGPGPAYTVYHRTWARTTSFDAAAGALA